jgi:hypothetical protein
MKTLTAILLFFLAVEVAKSDFTGFPVFTNSNAAGLYTNQIKQLFEAVKERSDLFLPSIYNANIITQRWTVFDSFYTNQVAWSNSTTGATGTYFNTMFSNTVAYTTNFADVIEYVNSESENLTVQPHLTYSMMKAIDDRMFSFFNFFDVRNNRPVFINTAIMSGGITNWLSTSYTDYAVYTNDTFVWSNAYNRFYGGELPLATLRDIQRVEGIGIWTVPPLIDAWGFITNGTTNSGFIVQDFWTNSWPLAETGYYATNWHFKKISKFSAVVDAWSRYYEAIPPVVWASTASTSGWNTVTIEIKGSTINTNSQSIADGQSEEIQISATGTVYNLTNYWADITGISVSGSGNTNDAITVAYQNPMTLYSSTAIPRTLLADWINTRWKILKNLSTLAYYPVACGSVVTNFAGLGSDLKPSYDEAKAEAIASWTNYPIRFYGDIAAYTEWGRYEFDGLDDEYSFAAWASIHRGGAARATNILSSGTLEWYAKPRESPYLYPEEVLGDNYYGTDGAFVGKVVLRDVYSLAVDDYFENSTKYTRIGSAQFTAGTNTGHTFELNLPDISNAGNHDMNPPLDGPVGGIWWFSIPFFTDGYWIYKPDFEYK